MDKFNLIAPAGIRYISDWARLKGGYNLANYQYPHILDKKIPGCGYTEYCLTNSLNIVLCSPRLSLLENKLAQHENEVFYFRNDFESDLNVDQDLTSDQDQRTADKKLKEEILKEELDENKYISFEEKRNRWLAEKVNEMKEYMYLRSREYKPAKILVTYDSFRILKEQLIRMGLFDGFFVVVDEFQSIFTDSAFKSTTELEFSYCLSDVKNLCYVSATPMLDSYLEQLDEFKNLPYFEIDWVSEDPTRLLKPSLRVRYVQSILGPALDIIRDYKSGIFEKSPKVNLDGSYDVIESREAVFYVNSVENIIKIINKAGLLPEECNILCSKTKFNDRRIKRKLGNRWEIGSIPLRGEQHKMFTFCTRTVYLGADFYSTNARSFVFSDANISSLMVDITIDLPQILGRQRLMENPWKNQADLYIKTVAKDDTKKSVIRTKEEFDAYIDEKVKNTELILSGLGKVAPAERHAMLLSHKVVAEDHHFTINYVAVNSHGGSDMIPAFNKLVMLSEKRAFDLQSKDYKDRFSVFNSLVGNGFSPEVMKNITKQQRVQEELRYIEEQLTTFPDRLRYLCESVVPEDITILLPMLPLEFKKYYELLGPERLKANGYRKGELEKEYLDMVSNSDEIRSLVYSKFELNEKYSRETIKKGLQDIFKTAGLNRTATAQSIKEFFKVEEKKFTDTTKNARVSGYLIVSRLD